MSSKCDTITLLDVSQKPFVPVRIVLEDRGVETIEWLVKKVEEILSKVGSDRPNAAYLSKLKVRVTKLVVGDLEIKRENWHEQNVDQYRLLDDPWFILTTRSPELPPGETVVATFEYKSPIQRSLSVCSGVGSINYSCGVVEFTDLASVSLQKRPWSASAPRWRRASPGLSVEGKCANEKCEANGNKVIINMGFCKFLLPFDMHKCKCPLCDTQVMPITCGFNNCRWKWGGTRFEFAKPPSIHGEKKWQVADDAYHSFCPKDGGNGGKAQWLRLLICTESSTQEPIVCSLCLLPGTDNIKVYECGHKLHTMCFNNYPQHPKEGSSVCPECFMNNIDKQI